MANRVAYILTFDREDNLNYKDIHDKIIAIEGITNWFHYIKSSYIFITTITSATTLQEQIMKIIPSKRFLLVEVNLKNRNGWLPPEAWSWIKKQTEKIS